MGGNVYHRFCHHILNKIVKLETTSITNWFAKQGIKISRRKQKNNLLV
jgi:hypothetical protein